jgi:hypothetical protein
MLADEEITSRMMFRGTHKPKATIFPEAEDPGKLGEVISDSYCSLSFSVMHKATSIEIIMGMIPPIDKPQIPHDTIKTLK